MSRLTKTRKRRPKLAKVISITEFRHRGLESHPYKVMEALWLKAQRDEATYDEIVAARDAVRAELNKFDSRYYRASTEHEPALRAVLLHLVERAYALRPPAPVIALTKYRLQGGAT